MFSLRRALSQFVAQKETHSSTAMLGSAIRAVGLATQLGVLVLMGRLLPKSVFGDAVLVFTGYRLLSYAIGSGAGSLLVYHVSRHSGDTGLDLQLSRRLNLITLALAAVVCTVCLLLAPSVSALFDKPGMAVWMLHMSPLIVAGALLQVTSSSLDARNRVTHSILLTELIPNLLRMLGIACVALFKFPQIAVAWVFWLAVAVPWMFDAWRLFGRSPPRVQLDLRWADARYAFWLGTYPLLGMQLQGIDMVIAGILFPSSAVAEYSIASRLATLFPFLQQMVVRVFTPQSGPLFKQNDVAKINRELESLRHLSLASTASMAAIILVAAPVVVYLMGDYTAGLGVLVALAIPPLIRSNFAGIEVVLKMRAQGWVLAVSAVASLFVVVVGTWFLHGAIAMYSLPVSMLISAVSINLLIAWHIHRGGIEIASLKLAPLIASACVALALAIMLLPQVATSLVGGAFMGLVAWVAVRHQKIRPNYNAVS